MLSKLEHYATGNWKILFIILFFPVAWIPWLFEGAIYEIIVKVLFLLLPVLFIIGGFWCSLLCLSTVIFRPNRVTFIGTILISWWDGGKAIFLYWGGIFRFLFLSFGWLWGALRIVVLGTYFTLRELLFLPFTFLRSMTKSYFKPGIPWIAVILTIIWITLESFIFSHVLSPMATEIIAQLTDVEPSQWAIKIILFLFLFAIIGGSFAALHGLTEAIEKKDSVSIVKMLIFETVIMIFEVLFLYREFVDSLAPWIAQMTNDSVHLGLGSILTIGAFSWLGIRVGIWFFFGKFGTPTLLHIISREGISDPQAREHPTMIGAPLQWMKHVISNLQTEINWFSAKGNEIVEAFVLPPVQILAVLTNFFMVLLTSKTLFNLPLRDLNDIKDTKALIEEMQSNNRG